MMVSSAALVLLVIPLGLLAATAWLWVRVVRGFTPANRDSATCGACGAGVRGIASFTCPECGADLREVGIITPKGRTRVSLPVFALGWTLLPLLPALVLIAILVALGPSVVRSTLNQSLSDGLWRIDWQAQIHPNSPLLPSTSVSSSSSTTNGVTTQSTTLQLGLQPSTEYDTLTIDLGGPTGFATLQYLPDTHAYRVLAPNTPPVDAPVPLTADDLSPIATEFEPRLVGILDLANGLAERRQSITVRGWAGGFSGGSTTSTRPARWYLALLLTIALATYAAGYAIYLRLRARADHPTDPTPAAPPV
ncbi:MAG: hypothetical protein AAF823_04355 [Planctomycetota bacterium]